MTAVTERPRTTRVVASPTQRGLWREVIVVLWLYFVYDMINNLSNVKPDQAIARAESVLRLEQRLHLDCELWLNQWVVRHHTIATMLGNFYNLAHIWVTLALIVFLWFKRRSSYADLRNALVLFNVIGFVVFWTYPVAPPRMLGGYVDVVETTRTLGSFHSGALANAANQLAAMPSLHIAWALWVVVAILRTLQGNAWRLVAAAHLVLTVVAVLGTGNHFVLDLLAGAVTAVVGFALAALWAERGRPVVVSWRASRRMSTEPAAELVSA
jgi:hypothetical protein